MLMAYMISKPITDIELHHMTAEAVRYSQEERIWMIMEEVEGHQLTASWELILTGIMLLIGNWMIRLKNQKILALNFSLDWALSLNQRLKLWELSSTRKKMSLNSLSISTQTETPSSIHLTEERIMTSKRELLEFLPFSKISLQMLSSQKM